MADHFPDATKKVDCISRETAITHIKEKQCKGCSDIGLCGNCAVLFALKLLKNVPAADVRPVVKAHWIYHEDDYGDYYECSNCHDEYVVYEGDMFWKHCPICGAEMEPDEDDQRGEKNNG